MYYMLRINDDGTATVTHEWERFPDSPRPPGILIEVEWELMRRYSEWEKSLGCKRTVDYDAYRAELKLGATLSAGSWRHWSMSCGVLEMPGFWER